MFTNVLFKFAPSSTQINGNIISGTFCIISISCNGIKSMLICSRFAAPNGVPDIYNMEVFGILGIFLIITWIPNI